MRYKTYPTTFRTILQGISPESTCPTSVLWFMQLLSKRQPLLSISITIMMYLTTMTLTLLTYLLTVMYALQTVA